MIAYTEGRRILLRGTIGDLQAADIRCALLQPASTYQSEDPTANSGFSAISTLTASTEKQIASIAVTANTARKLVFVTATDPAWTGLTLGEIVAGLLIYYRTSNFATGVPLFGIPRPVQYTITATGLFTWEWNDDGVIRF